MQNEHLAGSEDLLCWERWLETCYGVAQTCTPLTSRGLLARGLTYSEPVSSCALRT